MRFPYHGAGIALAIGKKVLMGRRSDHPFHGMWSIPGGCRERDKDTDELSTAVREFDEETGLSFEALDARYLGKWTLRLPFFSWTTFFYRTDSIDRETIPHEFFELRWLDVSEILEGTDKKKHFRPFTKSEVRSLARYL